MKQLRILCLLSLAGACLAARPTLAATPSPTPGPGATIVVGEEPTTTPTVTPSPTEIAPSTPVVTGTVTTAPTSPPSSTPTVTPLWPTDTPTPTPSATPTPACGDGWEPNQEPGSGPLLVSDEPLSELTLFPIGDVDFFRLWAKGGRFYQVTTSTEQGVDTRLRVFDPMGNLVAENDDHRPGDPAAHLRFRAPGEGWFAVAVDSRVPADWGCRGYSIRAVDVAPPSPTPTRTPGPPPTGTPLPTGVPPQAMVDDYEPNYDFGTAANLGVGQTLHLNFNPHPPGSGEVDNDFFRLYVKVGERLRIETANLAPGLDTNLLLYRENGQVIAGNDDCEPGQRYSCIEWSPDTNGLTYLLAGPVGTLPEATSTGARAYDLLVLDVAGETPTPSPGGGSAWGMPLVSATPAYGLPWPVTPVAHLSPTAAWSDWGTPPSAPTVTRAISVRPLISLSPGSAVSPVDGPALSAATPQPLTVDLTVYYDENDNRAPDANEGVTGVSVRVLDGVSNRALGQAFTDAQGHASLTVAAAGEVRVSVPYLGYNQAVQPPGKSLTIRLVPMRLPSLIP